RGARRRPAPAAPRGRDIDGGQRDPRRAAGVAVLGDALVEREAAAAAALLVPGGARAGLAAEHVPDAPRRVVDEVRLRVEAAALSARLLRRVARSGRLRAGSEPGDARARAALVAWVE